MENKNMVWLNKIIKENKESNSPLKYTECPFEVLYELEQQLDKANKKLDELKKIFKDYNIQKPVSGLSQCTYEITAEEMYKISQIIEESDK